MGGFLDGLDLTKLLGSGEPANFAIGGRQPVTQAMTPEGMPDLSQPLPEAPPMAAPPRQQNEADYLQAEGPGAGGTLLGAGGAASKPGLLSRLMATGPDGITFANKLMAAGSMLKGQGGQAMDYLQQQRDYATKQRLLTQAQSRKTAQAQAFYSLAQNDPTGRLAKMAPLVAAMGPDFDLEELAKAQNLFDPKETYQNAGDDLIETGGPNVGRVLYHGHGRAPPFTKWDEATKSFVKDQVAIDAAVEAYGGKERLKRFAPAHPMFQGSYIPRGAEPLPD